MPDRRTILTTTLIPCALPMLLFLETPIYSQVADGASAATAQAAKPPEATQIEALQSSGLNKDADPEDAAGAIFGKILEWGPADFDLEAKAGSLFNDNIYLATTHRTADLITTLSPDLGLRMGDYIEKKDNWLTLDYEPDFIHFTEHSANDAIDQNARFAFEWRPAGWTFGLAQDYHQLSGPVVEAAARAKRNVYDTDAYARYELDAKTSFELELTQSINDFDAPLFSYNRWTAGGLIDYWVTPKIRVGLGGLGGTVDVESSPDQTYQQGLLRCEYEASPFLALQLSVGPEVREFDSVEKDHYDAVFSFGGTYTYGPTTRFTLKGYRQNDSSLVADGQNNVVTGASLGASQIFAQKYIVFVDGGYDHTSYYATAPGVIPNGAYDYLFLKVAVDWHVSDQLTLGLIYQYQASESSSANHFDNNVAGLNAIYFF